MNRATRPSFELIAALVLVSLIAVLAIFGSFFETHDPMQGDLMARFTPMGQKGFLLGSDHLGRDIWSRMLRGLQWSMSCALVANLINLVVGAGFGLIAAESHGGLRAIARQVTDTLQSFPFLVVAIVVVVVIGHGFWPLVLTLGLLAWPIYQRVVFAEASSLYERDYVKAARISGASRVAIMVGHVLPSVRASLIVIFAFQFAALLIAESALSFLGIGAPLGVPTWGNILAESRQYILRAPWMVMVPSCAIVTAVVTMNLMGDALSHFLLRRRPT